MRYLQMRLAITLIYFCLRILMKGSDKNEKINGLGTWKRHNCKKYT